MLIPDLQRTKAVLVVFAMHGCGPCEAFLPKLMDRIDAHNAHGAPFHVWAPGQALHQGTIPVLLYDAASENTELQDLADRLGVSATPTTCLLTRSGTTKIEGLMQPDAIDRLLNAAKSANR